MKFNYENRNTLAASLLDYLKQFTNIDNVIIYDQVYAEYRAYGYIDGKHAAFITHIQGTDKVEINIKTV